MQFRLSGPGGTQSTVMTLNGIGAATLSTNSSSVVDILTLYNVSATSAGVRQKFQNGFGDLAAISVSQRAAMFVIPLMNNLLTTIYFRLVTNHSKNLSTHFILFLIPEHFSEQIGSWKESLLSILDLKEKLNMI